VTVRITVDRDLCQGYGQCTYEAEGLFHLDETGTSVPASDVSEDRRADAERAADVCPMQAITVEER
jgi:ferredoxin